MVDYADSSELERILTELNAPNSTDGRFSGDLFTVTAEEVLQGSKHYWNDLFVIKASGKLLEAKYNYGESITRVGRLVKTLVVLLKNRFKIIFVHGGGEPIVDTIEKSSLTEEQKRKGLMTREEIRYTPEYILKLIKPLAYALNESLENALREAGGGNDVRGFPGARFVGAPKRKFVDTETGALYDDNFYCELPPYHVIPPQALIEERIKRMLDFAQKREGWIAVNSFLVNSRQPRPLEERPLDDYGRHIDEFEENGDADQVGEWSARIFGNLGVLLQGSTPAHVHLIYLANDGGLRKEKDPYAPVIRTVTSTSDLRGEISGGMTGKVKAALRAASYLNYPVWVLHPRELLPHLFKAERALRTGFGTGYGTAFAPERLLKYVKAL